VENAAKLAGQELDFQGLFIRQEEDEEESASLGDVLEVLMKKWPEGFTPLQLAKLINNPSDHEREKGVSGAVRDFMLAGQDRFVSEKSFGKLLKPQLDAAVFNGLVLRKYKETDTNTVRYCVKQLKK